MMLKSENSCATWNSDGVMSKNYIVVLLELYHLLFGKHVMILSVFIVCPELFLQKCILAFDMPKNNYREIMFLSKTGLIVGEKMKRSCQVLIAQIICYSLSCQHSLVCYLLFC